MAVDNKSNRVTEAAQVTENLLRSGQISRSAAEKILVALGEKLKRTKTDSVPQVREDFLSWASAGFTAFFSALGASLAGSLVSVKNRPQSHKASHAAESDSVTRPVVGGIDALLSFEALAATLKPLFNEYVWWFIAMVLVISGSIMGIREAWLRFEGVLRPLTILFAFFTYHTLFLGLGIFLYKRSEATGRMLLILAATLIPVMFSIANSVTAQAAEAGAAAVAISLALSLITLYPIASRVGIPYLSAIFYLPVPFALTALAPLTTGIPWLSWVLIPALAAAILTATGLQENTRSTQKFLLSITGIIILFFTLATFPLAAGNDPGRAIRVLAVMAALAQFAFLLRALDFARARFFTAIEITIYAVIALIPVIAAGSFSGNSNAPIPFSYKILAYPFGIAVFFRAAALHNAAIHPLIFLTMVFLYHVARLITVEPAWQILAFFIFPLVLPWASSAFDERKKRIYLYWATIAGIIGSIAQWTASPPHIAAAVTGLLTAITIHRGAGYERSAFHYLSPIGLMVFIGRLPLLAGVVLQPFEIFFALAILYAVGGVIFERKAKRHEASGGALDRKSIGARCEPAGDSGGFPLEDLSLLSAIVALLSLNAFRLGPDEWLQLTMAGRILPLRTFFWFIPIWLFLTARALRDRSALVSISANLGAILFLFNWLQIRDYAEGGLFFLVLSAGFYAITHFFQNDRSAGRHQVDARHDVVFGGERADSTEKFGRVFLMRLKLPFNTGGINNIGQGAGITTLFCLLLLFLSGPNWIANPDFNRRGYMLLAEIGLMLMIFISFHFEAFNFVRLRGSIILLYALLFGIAFTAVINRIGRPLPIDVVGFKLLLLFPVMALATAIVKVYGPRYGKYLGTEKQGAWYYSVPVTGIIGLTLLLAYDGLAVSRMDFDRSFYFVPPTIYLALSLYPLVVAHTVSIHARHMFYIFIPVFIAAVTAERSFLGPDLSIPAQMNFSGNYTYLAFRQNIVLGIAGGVLALSILAFVSRRTGTSAIVTNALFSKNSTGVSHESGIWSLVFTGFIALMSFQVAAIPPGVILLVVAFFYLIAGNIRASAFILFLAGLLIVHGGAHLAQVYPAWPGPVLVLAAILMIYPAKKVAAKLDLSESFVSETGFLAGALYIVAGFFYAASEGRPANALQAGVSVLSANADYIISGVFYRAYALPLTFFLTSLFLWLALRRILGRARVALALLGHFAFTSALSTSAWLVLSLNGNAVTFLGAAPFVIVVVLLFEIIITARLNSLREKDADVYAGNFSARDATIVFCGLLFLPISQNPNNPIPHAGIATLLGLILYLIVNIQAAFTSQKTRYVYIAQATLAGIYYSARPMLGISNAQTDAFFAFGYAFALLGVSIAAERLGWTVVSEPTRRFAAIMPVVVALIIDNFRSLGAALYALIASGLYLSLSRLGERNIFAALAAITLNAALFFVALSQGFDSSEFYAFPIGLTIIFFATIFKGSLTPDNQARVRTIGGLIAYVPAAIHVTMRSGLAQNGMYSVVFGLICLAGIIAGTLMHVRSYLFLGSLFFTLNVVANLVQEGLQNQFVGFVLLTLTGLGLIAVLIIYNLKKEQIHAALGRLRQRFAKWD